MSDIKKWFNLPALNNSASPDGFPEGMAPSGVNDSAREVMAAVRRWYGDNDWRDFDHTATIASGTSFTLNAAVDYRVVYHRGRRIRMEGPSTWYGYVDSVSFSTNTRVTVKLDDGSLSGSLTSVSIGPAGLQFHSTPGSPLVKAVNTSNQQFAGGNTEATVLFGTKHVDICEQWATATGRMTPTTGGYGWYKFHASMFMNSCSANALYVLYIRDGANTIGISSIRPHVTNDEYSIEATAVGFMSSASSVCVVFENNGTSQVSSVAGNCIFIGHRMV